MGALTITTLGAPRILHDNAPTVFPVRKTLALTLYLAVTGQPHSRASLVALLWPEADEAHGALNLRQTLLRLRHALAPDGDAHLRTAGDLVSLNLGVGGTLDATRLAAATHAQTTPDDALAAVRSYSGPFLDHLLIDDTPDFMAWVVAQRAHWDACFDLIAERHILRLIDEGRAEDASALGQSWMTLRPDAEDAYRLFAIAQAAAGEGGGARLTLATLARRWGELGLPLAPTTERLRAQLDAQPVSAAPSTPVASPGRLVRLPFVGRRAAFVQARQAYQRALTGAPEALLVQGEAGVGKSRLVGALTRWAAAQGADVASGRAYELSGRLPYQPLMELLRTRLATERAPDDLLDDSWLIELQRLVPDLHDRYPDLPAPVDDAAAGARLLEAVAQVGIALARRRPLLWLIEDLHWADEATRAALLSLLMRWRNEGIPALLVGTIRSEEMVTSPELAGWFAAAQRTTHTTEVALTRLTAEQTTQVITALFDATARPEMYAWLYATTQGNPLYLEHSAQALVERGVATWQEDGTLRLSPDQLDHDATIIMSWLPDSLRELLLRRVRRLDSLTQQTLAAAAILGARFDEAMLTPVAGVVENDVLAALETAERAQLIRAETGQYIFTHDKVAEALYGDLTLARRRVFHRRALQSLVAARDTSSADLARHALGAEAWEQAMEYTLQAARAAEQVGAHRDVVRFYEQAAHLLTTAPSERILWRHLSEAAIFSIYDSFGRISTIVGEKEQARTHFLTVLAKARTREARMLEGRILFMLGRLALQHDYDAGAAEPLLKEAQQIAQERGDLAGQLNAEYMLAVAAEEQDDIPKASEYMQHAVHLAREQREGLAPILLQSGGVARARGQWEAACAVAEESILLFAAEIQDTTADTGAATAGDAPYRFVSPLSWSAFAPRIAALSHAAPTIAHNHSRQWGANALIAMGNSRLHLGEGATGRAAMEMAWQIFTERNEKRFQSHYLLQRTFGWIESGAYERALSEVQQTQEALRTAVEQPIDLTNVLPVCAEVDAQHALFRLSESREPLALALALAPQKVPRERLLPATRAVTQQALAGDWEAAHTAALQALAIREALPSFLPWFDFARYYETEALLRAGERDRAQADAERLGAHLDGNRRYRLLYLRMRALLDRDAGDHAAATAHLTEALGLATQMELPGEVWQIAAVLAESYASQRDPAHAHDARARAERVIALLGAQITAPSVRDHFTASALARLPAAS